MTLLKAIYYRWLAMRKLKKSLANIQGGGEVKDGPEEVARLRKNLVIERRWNEPVVARKDMP